jgi:hypothetical protein
VAQHLPSLGYDFRNSIVEAINAGADRSITFTIAVFEAHANRGQRAYTVQVRFVGIENLGDVATFFVAPPERRKLARIGYSKMKASSPGQLVVEIRCEKDARRLEVRCAGLEITGPRS